MNSLTKLSVSLLRQSNLPTINSVKSYGLQAWSIGNQPKKKTVAIKHSTKKLGFQVPLGTFVHERDIFLRQKGLRYHPGLNAALDPRDGAIYALRDGIIAISTERFIADMNHESVKKYYVDYNGPMMVRYVHVIPNEQPRMFKLSKLV